MARLIRYLEVIADREREFVVIETAGLSDDDFTDQYGASPLDTVEIGEDEKFTPFPTDRSLEAV